MTTTVPVSLQENGADGSLIKRTLKTIEALQARISELENATREPIAIIGMGCRFPGGITDADSYWRILRDGVDAILDVPANRWDSERYFDADPNAPGKMYTRRGGFIDGIDLFDAAFFHLSPREAASLDPQHRLLLETAWETLENAGIAPLSLRGKPVGIFVGLCSNDYAQLLTSRGEAEIDAYFATGTTHSMAAGRLSYLFGSTGPNLAVDTACSSSLSAVHLAMQSLRSGESSIALAGGANCILTPGYSINFCKANMLSADGRCKSFDAAADGFVRGEGAGMVALKRLSHALRDGDRVLAVLRGSAMNQDGHTSGPTVPSGLAQAALIRRALKDAGVRPAEVTYLEAHGTGTSLGDPIEAAALSEVFGTSDTPASNPLFVGSVKTNIGHLEGAAGIAGLIKVVLALQHRTVPGNLNFQRLSPHIQWDGQRLEVPSRTTPWQAKSARIAGVSSFGFSGTNVHLIVQEAPEPASVAGAEDRNRHVLTLSAASETALRELAGEFLEQPNTELADIAFTANNGRSHFSHKLAVVAGDWREAARRIRAFLDGGAADGVLARIVPEGAECNVLFEFAYEADPKLRFEDLTRNVLYRTQTAFRAVVDECLTFRRDTPSADVFILQVALAEMWRSWGVHPAAVRGQYAALHLAGVYGREDALRLSCFGRAASQSSSHPATLPVLGAGEEAGYTLLQIGASVPDWECLATTLQRLYVEGAEIDWSGWERNFPRRKVVLPSYPFQRRRHWYCEESEREVSKGPNDSFAYEVQWQASKPFGALGPAELLSGISPATADNGLLADIEALSADYAAAAVASVGKPVPANQRRLFECLRELAKTGNPSSDPARLLSNLIAAHPEARAELQLVGRCGTSLPKILAGEANAVETLFQAGIDGPDKIYRDSPSSLAANRIATEAIGRVIAAWPGDRRLRVLEAGAGTGGTTHHLIERIRPLTGRAGGVDYIFTDVSRAFLTKARERFAAVDFMRFEVLDIEKPAESQGFAPGSCDVVVAANVLHATADVRASVENLRALLAPGGLLLLTEVTEPRAWLDVTFGLLDGWWRFRDTGLRSSHPLLSATQWRKLLDETGFESAAFAEAGNDSSLLRQAVIMARAKSCTMAALSKDLPLPDPLPERMVWLSDKSNPAEVCSDLLDIMRRVRTQDPVPRIWAVLRDPNGLTDAALAGFGRTSGLEHPEAWRGLLHLPGNPTADQACHFAALAEAFPDEKEIRFRDGKALRPRIVPLPSLAKVPEYRFSADGSYLITGGLGFLGLRLSNWMANRGARNLVLMGRTGATEPKAQKGISELMRLGVHVEVVKGDASQSADIRRALDAASSLGPLRGVVHMAARGHSQPLFSLSSREIEAELAPKIGGALSLHEQTLGMPLDFFVLCSSASSIWGAKGQAHYAAANSCLDWLAHKRRQEGLKALSVNWGLLTGGAMVSDEYRNWLTRAGIEPLEAEDGFRELFQLIDGPAAQVLLARVNWIKFSEIYGTRGQSTLFEQVAVAEPKTDKTSVPVPRFREMAPAERLSALTDLVREQFCRTLELPLSEAPQSRQGFFDAGMDSLLAIEFRNCLQESVGIELPSAAAFNHPNVEAMARHLDRLLAPAAEQAEVPRLTAAERGDRMDVMLEGVEAFLRGDLP